MATANLTTPGATEIDISRSGIGGGAISADTINIDTSNFALLNTFMGGNELTIKFDGGEEFQGTPLPFVDTMNVNGASTSVTFGLTLQSTSAINSGANISAKDLTLTSAQTASDLLSTGLFANANTAIELTGAHLTTTAGALNLNANSTIAVTTDGTGMSAVKGAVITSFSTANIDVLGSSVLSATGGDVGITANVNGTMTATASAATVKLIVIAGSAAPEVTIGGNSTVTSTSGAVNAAAVHQRNDLVDRVAECQFDRCQVGRLGAQHHLWQWRCDDRQRRRPGQCAHHQHAVGVEHAEQHDHRRCLGARTPPAPRSQFRSLPAIPPPRSPAPPSAAPRSM